MKIQQIRNATLKIMFGDQVIVLDPWFQDKGTGFSARTVKPEMAGIHGPMNDLPFTPEEIMKGVDFCLVTHLHPDHFTSDYLEKDVKIVAQNEEDRKKVEDLGFTNVLAFEGPELKVGSITITKVPALHGDNPDLVDRMGTVSGFIFEGEDKILYIAADTIYYEGVEKILEQYHPDVIALNCCEATTPRGRLIMGPDDVKKVCEKAPWALVIATHLDSVNHALVTSDDVRRFVRQEGLTQVVVPANGEWVEA